MLIKNGHVVDPAHQRDGVMDVLIVDGKIAKVGVDLPTDGDTFDASGCYVFPGLVDMHCHLRDPGLTYKEDIISGALSGAKGGFTSLCCMANTSPVNDNAAITKYIVDTAQNATVRVYPIGAITKGLKGEELAEMGEMKQAGIVAVSDDGHPVMSALIMRHAMQYASAFHLPVISHCEDKTLAAGGVMNEGINSTRFGLKGIPRAAEEVHIAREITLSETMRLPIHIAHVSTRGGVEAIRAAKSRGVKVTAETAPHYLTLTDDMCATYDALYKVNPPLRTIDDISALKNALKDGTIDAIATDHAPHHMDEKRVEFALATSGFSGLETALPLCIEALRDIMSISDIIMRMSTTPAQIMGLPGGAIDGDADIIVYDPNKQWSVIGNDLVSKGKNTPYEGRTLTGAVKLTLVGGKVAWQA